MGGLLAGRRETYVRIAQISLSQDLDGVPPYLDPLEPIPLKHIQKAAQKTARTEEEIKRDIAEFSRSSGIPLTIKL